MVTMDSCSEYDDSKRESPEQKSPGVVLADRPAVRGFTDCVDGSIQFFDEVRSRLGAALPIPGDCAPNICDCALVVLNTPSAHSPWPRVRDAVVPKGRSPPCPFSDLRFRSEERRGGKERRSRWSPYH